MKLDALRRELALIQQQSEGLDAPCEAARSELLNALNDVDHRLRNAVLGQVREGLENLVCVALQGLPCISEEEARRFARSTML